MGARHAPPGGEPIGRVVVALGGNALLRRGERADFATQRQNVERAAERVVELAGLVDQIVVTHGNGPQVGYLALQAEAAMPEVPAPPLDVLGAESQGQIGYLLSQAFRTCLAVKEDHREIAVVLTQVIVDVADPAFQAPTKPVGPVYTEEVARQLARERGWSVARDGSHWRRVVPSPVPLRIVEAAVIRRLVQSRTLVIASGGGGVPVVEDGPFRLRGTEAVIDKDLAAVVLAQEVRAEGLILLTDVDGVYRGWGTSEARCLPSLSICEAEELLGSSSLPAGSMAPKVRACMQFVKTGGRFAAIGALDDAAGVIAGSSGTRFYPD